MHVAWFAMNTHTAVADWILGRIQTTFRGEALAIGSKTEQKVDLVHYVCFTTGYSELEHT